MSALRPMGLLLNSICIYYIKLKDQLLKESKQVAGPSTAELIKKATKDKAKRNGMSTVQDLSNTS